MNFIASIAISMNNELKATKVMPKIICFGLTLNTIHNRNSIHGNIETNFHKFKIKGAFIENNFVHCCFLNLRLYIRRCPFSHAYETIFPLQCENDCIFMSIYWHLNPLFYYGWSDDKMLLANLFHKWFSIQKRF